MKPSVLASVLLGVMLGVAAAGFAVRPALDRDRAPRRIDLAAAVPKRFEGWSELPASTAQVVNPQTQALLDKLYSQVLTRTYVNADGYRIMLSVAYGDDQRGGLEAHRPEVCYPAQGFALLANQPLLLDTRFGPIAARRLDTQLGPRREPVTYWFAMGDQAVGNRLDARWVELRLALSGQVPHGLLFRVSSIDGDKERAYAQQRDFVDALLGAVAGPDRLTLSGLAGAATP